MRTIKEMLRSRWEKLIDLKINPEIKEDLQRRMASPDEFKRAKIEESNTIRGEIEVVKLIKDAQQQYNCSFTEAASQVKRLLTSASNADPRFFDSTEKHQAYKRQQELDLAALERIEIEETGFSSNSNTMGTGSDEQGDSGDSGD